MCDCYLHECKVCGYPIPIHLGDYATKRNEIEVFCHKHLPENDVTIFTIDDDETHYDCFLRCTYPRGYQMGIRYLTLNSRENKCANHPNIGADFKIVERE